MIKYCLLLLFILGGWSLIAQNDSCNQYTQQMDAIQDMMAKQKEANNTTKLNDWDKKYRKLKNDRDSCMARAARKNIIINTDTFNKTPVSIVPAPAPPIAKPVPSSPPAEAPLPKKDTVATIPKDDKLSPPAAQKPKSDPSPKTNKEKIAARPVAKDTIVKVVAPPPPPARGINYASRIDTIDRNVNSFKVRIEGKDFYFIVVDLEKSDIKLHLHHTHDKERGRNFSTIESLLSSGEVNIAKVEMITNGGMYMHDGQPQGLYVENGREMAHLDSADPKNGDNFHLMPNGIFFIKKGEAHILTTDSFKKTELGDTAIDFATQSGPMLVIDGKRHPAFTEGSRNEKLRSGVCLIDKKTVVFAICDQVNFWDFANFFKDYIKGHNALFLDGSVSRMYLKKGLKGNIRKDMDGTFGPMISVTAK